jgi:signal transduction histidine kinase
MQLPTQVTEWRESHWDSFLRLWERANLIRSFVWSQDGTDEHALLSQFLVRMRRFFNNVDFCFGALREEGGKVTQAGVPEAILDQLPADFVRRSMDLVANSPIPVVSKQLYDKTGFQTAIVAPLSPAVGQPFGFLMLGHSRSRHFNKAELFLLQSLAGEVSWAVRELRSRRKHQELLAAASLELKNSLQMVLGECSILREVQELEPATERDRRLSSIEKNTRETLRTIGSFLDNPMAGEQRLAAARESIDLLAVVEAALVSSCLRARQAGVELQAQYASDLPGEYFTDPARFGHVVRNLVDLAIEFSEPGRLLLSVRKNSEFVEFSLRVSEPKPEAKAESRSAVAGGQAAASNFACERLEMIRENLKLLNGHLHFVDRPGAGVEIGICLA